MYPVAFSVGPLALPTYGVAIAFGYLFGALLAARAGRRVGIGADRVLDLSFWVIVAAFLGSRLLFVLTNADVYVTLCSGTSEAPRSTGQLLFDCTRSLHIWDGGYVFYGGFLALAVTVVWYCRKHELPLLKVADIGAPSLALSHFFGRLGCYGAGCCYGKVTDAWCGVGFPPKSLAYREYAMRDMVGTGALLTPTLHPTQLYEAGAELLIFVVLLWISGRRRAHGQTLAGYLLLYPPVRAVIELYRGDPNRRFLLTLATPGLAVALGLPPEEPLLISTSQTISAVMFVCGIILMRYVWTRPKDPQLEWRP